MTSGARDPGPPSRGASGRRGRRAAQVSETAARKGIRGASPGLVTSEPFQGSRHPGHSGSTSRQSASSWWWR